MWFTCNFRFHHGNSWTFNLCFCVLTLMLFPMETVEGARGQRIHHDWSASVCGSKGCSLLLHIRKLSLNAHLGVTFYATLNWTSEWDNTRQCSVPPQGPLFVQLGVEHFLFSVCSVKTLLWFEVMLSGEWKKRSEKARGGQGRWRLPLLFPWSGSDPKLRTTRHCWEQQLLSR